MHQLRSSFKISKSIQSDSLRLILIIQLSKIPNILTVCTLFGWKYRKQKCDKYL